MNVLPILVKTKQGLYPFDRLFPIKLGPCEDVAVSYITVDIKRMSITCFQFTIFCTMQRAETTSFDMGTLLDFMAALFQLPTNMYNENCV